MRIENLTIVCVVIFAAIAAPAPAADVKVEVSSREVYVDVPFSIVVTISNAKTYEQPEMPAVEGLRFSGTPSPSRSSFMKIVNGRMSKTENVSYSYRVLASKLGSYTIPSFRVVADGGAFETRPIEIVVTDTETGDLLFVEAGAERPTYYVGESIPVELRIWIKPFRDRRYGVFDAQAMWDQLDHQVSRWGVFEEGLRSPSVKESLREDADGVRRSYYCYFVRAVMTPHLAGMLAFDDVAIVVRYPKRFITGRGSFGRRRPGPGDEKTIVGRVDETSIEIKPLPEQGRPEGFSGAVGQFDFKVSAKPTDVAVGDPITLTMRITDTLESGDVSGKLEMMQAPALDRIKVLADFKVPSEALAGVVDGRYKTFTQTLRAKHDDVEVIPAIPFAYFDPVSEAYATAQSDAIPLSVKPASTVKLSEVVAVDNGQPTAPPTELTEVSGGVLANYADPQAVLSVQDLRPGWPMLAIVLCPPVVFLVTAVTCWRVRRVKGDVAFSRRRTARRRAVRRIGSAGDAPQTVGAAVCDYVADRLNLPPGAMTRAEVVRHLQQASVSPDLLSRVEEVLGACERLQYAGGDRDNARDLTNQAESCIAHLERERLR